jgi:dihydroflavonol-4-reductase
VTGANGFLGANVVRELLDRGHHVRAFVRKGSDLSALHRLPVELFYGDLLDEVSVRKAVCGCDYVIHAAGKPPDRHSNFEQYARINVSGTQHVIDAVEKYGVKRMVYVGSSCVFGGGIKGEPATELSEFTGFKYNSGYINSKYLAQQWVLSEVEKKELPIVVVNPTILLGPYDSHSSSREYILRQLKHRFHFCPNSVKNFIDVRDAAMATCNALTMGIPGECYLLASENLTFSSLLGKINSIFGRSNRRIPVPGAILRFTGLMGNLFRMFIPSATILTLGHFRQLAAQAHFSAGKAIRELGLPQRPVDEAIRDAIAWYVVNGRLEECQSKKTALQTAA